MEGEEMNNLEFRYMLLTQRANYYELLEMTDDEILCRKIHGFIDVINETINSK